MCVCEWMTGEAVLRLRRQISFIPHKQETLERRDSQERRRKKTENM